MVCKKSKQSGTIYVTLLVSSEQTKFRQVMMSKFHGVPLTEFVLSIPYESSSSPSRLQYRPSLKLILPSNSNPVSLGEFIEPELFLQLFGPKCHLADAAVLLVCGPNGHILYCNLRSINITTSGQSSREGATFSNQHKFFKPLYSIDQPVISVHAAAFPKRREQLDPLIFCDDDDDSSTARDGVSNTLLFLGQRGKIAMCYADGTTTAKSQKVAKFVEYNVPAPMLSSRLIPGQCLIYNSERRLHRICLRQTCFKEIEENVPPLQSQSGPLLIPEASFKFPERVAISIPPSALVDCELVTTDVAGPSSTSQSSSEEIGVMLMALKGDLRSLKINVCGVGKVPRDPDVVAKEIKQCLNSIQATSEQVSSISNKISKVNSSLTELNHVLTLLCTVKCHQEGTPCFSGDLECPIQCTMSAGFTDLGVLERAMCIDVTFSYRGNETLGSGWLLLIQVSPLSHKSHHHYLNSRLCCDPKNGRITDPTPTTLSKSVPLEGLNAGSIVEERVPVSLTCGRPPCFSVSCYLHYDASTLVAALDEDYSNSPVSCDHTVSVLVRSRLMDALDFTLPLLAVPRKLHDPLSIATSCLDSKYQSSLRSGQQPLMHSLQFPIQSGSLSPPLLQSTSQPDMNRKLSDLLLPHIPRVDEKLQNGTEIRLTSYDGSSIALRLLKPEGSRQEVPAPCGYCLTVRSSSRAQLAEVVRCIDHRLYHLHHGSDVNFPVTTSQEELYKREAELKGISREAVSLLDRVATSEKLSREPPRASTNQAELVANTFSLYSRLRHLPRY